MVLRSSILPQPMRGVLLELGGRGCVKCRSDDVPSTARARGKLRSFKLPAYQSDTRGTLYWSYYLLLVESSRACIVWPYDRNETVSIIA